MLALFTLTKATMDALRGDSMPEIEDSNLFDQAQNYYTALVSKLEETWRTQGLTIVNFNVTVDSIVKQTKGIVLNDFD
jgi:hypothetical protein